MGQRRKNQNKQVDPIVASRGKKKVKQNQSEDQDELQDVADNSESDQLDVSLSQEEEDLPKEQSAIEKFNDLFNQQQSDHVQISNQQKQRLEKIQVQLKLADLKASSFQGFQDHFSAEHSKPSLIVVQNNINMLVKKVSANEKIKEQIKDIFDIGQQKEREPLQEPLIKAADEYPIKDQVLETLSNQISIQNYMINRQFKTREPCVVQECEEYLMDRLSKEFYKSKQVKIDDKQQENSGNIFYIPIENQKEADGTETEEQKELTETQIPSAILSNYQDMIYIDPEEAHSQNIRELYCTHILKHFDNCKKAENNQGYTKCRVLILAPFRGDAAVIIKELIKQYTGGQLKQTSFKQKFQEDFEDPQRVEQDDFKLGIAFGYDQKTIKLYTSFNNSDIIVASPLSLRLLTGAKGESDRNDSILSSIEVVVIDRASTILMQNWIFLEEMFENMNRIPKHDAVTNSLDEIRPYFFDNQSNLYRQNIVYSQFNFPELNILRNNFFNNHRGCLQNKHYYEALFDDLVKSNFNQEFVKLEINDFKKEIEERFVFFQQKIWEMWVHGQNIQKAVIFVSSYFQFLKLKDYFKQVNSPVEAISEYTEQQKIQSRTSQFNKGEIKFLLVTERSYYFQQCQIKNMDHILFYSLPQNSFIYQEIIQSINCKNPDITKRGPSEKSQISSVFTKFDSMALERIVGSQKLQELLADYNQATSFII